MAKTPCKRNAILLLAVLIPSSSLFSVEVEQAGAAESRKESIVDLDPVRVVGTKETIELLPGAAAFIDREDIRIQSYDNIEQLLRQVPGAYFRTEDGFGLFPNISLRGVGSMRTTKLTVMEDGVLTAPAPYASPAAYYTPTSGRMDGIEILKGSSQVRHGPHTTGGVINYLSTPVPADRHAYARGTYGENNEFRFHGFIGETVPAGDGRFGYLLENYYRSSDGFKTIDGIGNIPASDRTGFRKNEPMFKARWDLPTANRQSLEFKIGYTDLVADETYLGLSEEDFRNDPYRRYASTMFDRIEAEQLRTFLRHRIEPTRDSSLTTTGYFNDFSRAWYKINDVNAGAGNVNLSEALAANGDELAVLRGEMDGTFRVRNNNRDYASYGIESIYQHRVAAANADHNFEIGVRLHEDYEDRFQQDDTYQVVAGDRIFLQSAGAPGSQDNRRGTARAMAIHLRDRIEFDRWSVTPGLRYEHIRFINENRANPAQDGRTSLDVFAPGIGATYEHTDRLSFFGGVHRGFSTPGPSAAVQFGLQEENSIGYETGVRYDNRRGFQTEAVLFLTDFRDMIVRDSVGGAGSAQAEDNLGRVRSMGLEGRARYDPGVERGWRARNPNTISVTLTDATLRSDVGAGGASGAAVESVFAGGEKGNRVPYIPTYQIAAGTGLEIDKWGVYLDAFFVPWTYADASNRGVQERPDGTPDARFGKNDSYFLLDFSVHYRFTESAKLIAGVHNLLNEEYVASRLPHGPRPGAPRFASLGLEVSF